MCTVTFIPTRDGYYLTSNRDESSRRGAALAPRLYSDAPDEYICPRDPDAGGSWIVLRSEGTAAVLLNGAFQRHHRNPPYRLSRGVILLTITRAADPLAHFQAIDLAGIEPFTLILLSRGELRDCRWDGWQKYILTLDPAAPHIWSSATLYDEQTANTRRLWFGEWHRQTPEISPAEVIHFHRSAGDGDIRNSLVMRRDNLMSTVSVTSIAWTKDNPRMIYHDLKTAGDTTTTFPPKPHNPGTLWIKKFLTRLTHWEYWPSFAIYGPLYLYWFWLSAKARSFFFFSAANPAIENAGFTHERKSQIYQQIPQEYYPRTQLCPAGIDYNTLEKTLHHNGFRFPLIAKPDIGERGTRVALINSSADLKGYCRNSRVDLLIQEFIPFENEVGIFYVRIPGEAKGRITGIVGKELLSVTGDGKSTIRTLLQKDPRSLLQLDTLARIHGDFLDTILPPGASHTLVPYGNHCRGAKFLDWSDRITQELTSAIDTICRRIPDFYFGRLDIKFDTWEHLVQGKNFSIIELNGAGSEPTHIYDPAHTLFFAWKEIIHHWRLLYRISRANAKNRQIPLMSTREGLKMLRAHLRHLKLMKE